jgi:hypothetical protein
VLSRQAPDLVSELSPPEDVARCIMMCARIPPGQPPARLGWSWISLTSSLALRVLDEAANDFL